MRLVPVALLLMSVAVGATEPVTVKPAEYPGALRNPLMGISPKNYTSRATYGSYMALRGTHPWGTLTRTCIPWSWLDNADGDGIEKIRTVTDELFTGLEAHNTKAMPRVYLYWPGAESKLRSDRFYMRGEFWPVDLKAQDISSPRFIARLQRLVKNLGEVWDNDPRIGIIEMGIIGKWGEQTDPGITPAMEKILGDAFAAAFKNKKVMTRVRPMTNFHRYPFGLHWDSFAHQDQLDRDGKLIAESQKWKVAPIGGETAYDWGNFRIQPGNSPTDSLANPTHRDFIINLVRKLHVTQLGWIAEYDQSNPQAVVGAELLQKALGYRFVLREVTFPRTVEPARAFRVEFVVRNDGSAPFYEKWPVALFLLDPNTRQVIWQQPFAGVDVREWMPGDDWDETTGKYRVAPAEQRCASEFQLPANLAKGEYVLALAVLDPQGGMLPALRFANSNYWNGGYFPAGRIGVGVAPVGAIAFDDPGADRSVHYINPRLTPAQRAAVALAEQRDPLALFRPVNWWTWTTLGKNVGGELTVRDVSQPEPGLTLRYDFTNATNGPAAGATTDIWLPASASSLNISVRSASRCHLVIVFRSADGQSFEQSFRCDHAGEWQKCEVVLDGRSLSNWGTGDKVLRFPIVRLTVRAQAGKDDPRQGEMEIRIP